MGAEAAVWVFSHPTSCSVPTMLFHKFTIKPHGCSNLTPTALPGQPAERLPSPGSGDTGDSLSQDTQQV